MTTPGGRRLDERLGSRLGGVEPGRLQVVGGHAPRDVEGQDDRALFTGQVDPLWGRAMATVRMARPSQEQDRREALAQAVRASRRSTTET